MKRVFKNAWRWVKTHRRPVITWTVVVLCICFLAILQIDTSTQPAPYDPTSTAPDGTKAFAMLMQQAGAQFNIGDAPGNGTAILINDNLSDAEAGDVADWVKSGGTLVVADVYSQLADSSTINPPASQPLIMRPQCNANFASDVASIQPNSNADYSLFEADGTTSAACFPVKNGYFVMEHDEGNGRVIDIGTPSIFTNQDIAKLDNSVLVTNLMQPGPDSQITWLTTQDTTGSSSSVGAGLNSLIPPHVKEGWWQLIVAAIALSLWRGRRLGAPVEEPQQVEIPASQLVVATGNLLQTANQSQDAAAMMRADLTRSLTSLLGLPPNVDTRVLIEVAHARTNIAVERLEAVIYGVQINDNTELVKLAQQIEYLQMEVGRVR